MAEALTEQDWDIRLFIYQVFADRGSPPSVSEAAGWSGTSIEDASRAFHRLHRGHALFLEPGTDDVRMANPLSAIPTSYRVEVGDRTLYANCAWDSVGIPAMLHLDASINVRFDGEEPIGYSIRDGALDADPRLVVHFPVRFSHWYDDLIHT